MQSSVVRNRNIIGAKRWDFEYFDPEYRRTIDLLRSSKWPIKRLDEIVSNLTDGQHGYLVHLPSGVPLLRTSNVFENEIRLDDVRYIAPEVHAEIKRSQLRPGDVLLTTIGSIGLAAVVDESLGEANINQNLVKMTPNPEVNSGYLALFFNSRFGRIQTERTASKSVVPIVNYTRLREALIPLPPRSVQDHMAQEMQDAYATRRARLAEAEALQGGIEKLLLRGLGIDFEEASNQRWFVIKAKDLDARRFDVDFHLPQTERLYMALRNAKNCKVLPLGTLVKQIANGATPKGANYLTEGIPFFRIQNVTPEGIDMSDVRYISRATHDEMRRSQTKPGDLLMTITGRVGTAARVPDDVSEGNINQHLVILRLKPESVDADYLAAIINSAAVSFQIQHRTTGTTRIALDYEAIKALAIPVPSAELQHELAREVSRRHSESARLRAQADAVVVEAKARVERMILGEESLS
jgi:type I restriction enzyme, S subunit